MKLKIKYFFSRLGILNVLEFIRRIRSIFKWFSNGCYGVIPQPLKRKFIYTYLKKYNIRYFVETGTHEGDTLAYVAFDKKIKSLSIELSDYYYEKASKRFKKYDNVQLFKGDSGVLITKIISELEHPAVFWLDGHYSGGKTAKGEYDTPISAELDAIIKSPIEGNIILVDDIRCFNGLNGYPFIEDLVKEIRKSNKYDIEISGDILRLVSSSLNK
jgi:hypothetical protein